MSRRLHCIMLLPPLLAAAVPPPEHVPCSIVISAEAPEVAKFAAAELQHVLRRATGRNIPIVPDADDPPAPRLLLGVNRFTRDLQSQVDRAQPEGFIIRKRDADIAILGDDLDVGQHRLFPFDPQRSHKGSLFGVYTFLERFCGVRWFWPGPSGEIVPEAAFPALPETLAIAEKPFFGWRHHFLYSGPPLGEQDLREILLWYMRARHGIACGSPYSFAHSWGRHLGGNRQFDAHPEHYAYLDGERRRFYENARGNPELKGRQVCTSNTETVETFLTSLRRNPPSGMDIFSVSPNDGGGFCECRCCQALERSELYAPDDGYDGIILSDRVFTFVNQLARGVSTTHPQRHLGIFAYTYVRTPPRTLPAVEPNIVVSFTQQMSLYNDPELKQRYRAQLHEWLSKGNRVVLRDYLGLYNFAHILIPQVPLITEDLRHGASHAPQVIGFYSETGMGDLVTNHRNYYVLSRLLWNPAQRVQPILDDYYAICYSSAAGQLRRFFDLLEADFANRRAAGGTYLVGLDKWLSAARVAQCNELLAEARTAAADQAVQRRIGVVERGFGFTACARAFIAAAKELTDSGLPLRLPSYTTANAATARPRAELLAMITAATDAYEAVLARIKALEDDTELLFSGAAFRRLDTTYRWGATLEQYRNLFAAEKQTVVVLPDVWRFRLDETDVGEQQGWHLREFDDSRWPDIRVDDFWERQGYGKDQYGDPEGYNGCAWYRLHDIRVPERGRDLRCRLQLGAVDEDCWVYINGALVGEHIYDADTDPDAWKKPQDFDLTGAIEAAAANTLAIKVRDRSGAGGIWRKAYLLFSPAQGQNGTSVFLESFETKDWAADVGLNESDYRLELSRTAPQDGQQSLRVSVAGPLPAQCVMRWRQVPVQADTVYTFEMFYRVHSARENGAEKSPHLRTPQIPLVRLIPCDAAGKRVVETKQYIWAGAPFQTQTDAWQPLRRVFRTPDRTQTVSLTIFLNAQGDYELDAVSLIRH